VTIPTAITVTSISVTGLSSFIGTTSARFGNGFFTSLNPSTNGVIEQTGSGNFVTLRNTAGDGVRLRASGRVELDASASVTAHVGSAQILWCDTNGIRIGGTSFNAQRIGFYGATPILRQTGWSNLMSSATLANVIDRINAVTMWLRSVGLTS